jgi:serine/threonine-protein kinase
MNPDPQVLRAQARVGSTVRDKWQLDGLLAVGGMASVYAATHRNGSRAAVKMLNEDMATNELARERFLWEGYVANAVRHDGVVKVIDDDTDEDGTLYLVTELLDGETLEERRLRLGGRIAEDECLLVIDELLDVLAAAHAAGIVHRDIKPDNLFLTREGGVKVLDFGIAKLREPSTSKRLTQMGLTLGTPGYMPPEQARGLSDEVDERSDIWACGATMYCLLSGETVHNGSTAAEQLVNAMTKAVLPLQARAPDIGLSVAHVVDRALEFSKSDRWPTAAAMQEAVHQAYEDLCGIPIGTAPRLALGGGVPGRTPHHQSGIGPFPDQRGTSTPRSDISSYRPMAHSVAPRPKPRAAAVGAAIGLGVAALGVAFVIGFGYRGSRVHPQLGAAASGRSLNEASTASGGSSVPPEVSVTDLPIAATAMSEGERLGAPLGETRSAPMTAAHPSKASAARPACRPPYVVDPTTEKKRWKIECL